jgi:hypothetical protein
VSRDIVPRSFRAFLGLVVPAGIQRQLAEQHALFRDDSDVEVADEHQDPRRAEPPSEADVVQLGVVTDLEL